MKKSVKLMIVGLLMCAVMPSCLAANVNATKAKQMCNLGHQFQVQKKYAQAVKEYSLALKMQPDMADAKNNLYGLYEILADQAYKDGRYPGAIYYAKKSLEFKADDVSDLLILGNSYSAVVNVENAKGAYQRILEVDAKNVDAMKGLAALYVNANDYQNASAQYHNILAVNPHDKAAKEGISNIQRQLQDNAMKSFTKISTPAPSKVYKLVKVQKGVPDVYALEMNRVLDLIWNNSNGRIILNTIARHNVQIKVVPASKKIYTDEEEVSIAYSPSCAGAEDKYIVYYTNIVIPVNYIDNVNNRSLPAYKRIYNLAAVTRELAHAFMYIKNRGDIDSVKEEVGLSLVGYNLASRVLTGQYLTNDQAAIYIEESMKEILANDTKKLPLKCNFTKSAPRFGLKLRNVEEYNDIQGVYNTLVEEGKIKPVSYIKVKK